MRRIQMFLLSAGLLAAPAGATAQPIDSTTPGPVQSEKSDMQASKRQLGVLLMSLTPELRTHFGSTDGTGVLVAQVKPGSPAALAGIGVGDMLVAVHGQKVDDSGDVISALARTRSDAAIKVRLLREGKPVTLDVRFDTSPTSQRDLLPGFRWLREIFGTAPDSTST